ncbi:hypothetical protein Syun_026688 [Stephania yunnanensis]|uniref:Saccharopine dehydrogenase (NAD(+), L-glutamate-forming) n=1 Tax=Stephania yunnanensis TaxID=152371 RepID=A0AAP0HSF1_9MAGN
MLGNGVVGILSESTNKWERRAPLSPSHCARLLHEGRANAGVSRIIVQPSPKRIHHDALYEDVGCQLSHDLSQCGLILGIKQPMLDMILPDRAYSFFSHTHKAQKENMPLLDKILAERASLFDYELIVGDHGKRLLAFGKFAGRAGMIDFLHGLGKRYLSLGYSTPFLSLGASYMYTSLVAAKAAVIAVGEEIATLGLPPGICPLVFVFTGSGNVSQGAQEIFRLLPHAFVDPGRLSELAGQWPCGYSGSGKSDILKRKDSFRGKTVGDHAQHVSSSKRVFQVYGCVVTCKDMVEPKDPTTKFDKADYYTHPEHYSPIFHERIAPFASVIVNCMYWEKRFPRLLSTKQLQELMTKGSRLVGISDITCDIGGSLEFVNQSTSIDKPFFRYDPLTSSYHYDMEGSGVICLAVDILPTEFAKEASQHFGDILSQFIGSLASMKDTSELPSHLRRACIVHKGHLTSFCLPENSTNEHFTKKHKSLVSLSGHLFDQFLINEALDIIEAAGGSFHLVRCEVGQSSLDMSYSELEVSADDSTVLDQIIDSLTSISNPSENSKIFNKETDKLSLIIGKVSEAEKGDELRSRAVVLILGAGRVCRPAVAFLASNENTSSHKFLETTFGSDTEELKDVQVIVASLYLKDAEETIDGIPNASAVQLDVMDSRSLHKYISEADVVISLLPPSCHIVIAEACIKLKKNLVTASYVTDSLSKLSEEAKSAGITILGEMGLDPGIDHMMAMKMINQARVRGGRIQSFWSYCGGLPSPMAANNPLAYKFSWNPAGALRAGSNPATYKSLGEIVQIDGFCEIMGSLKKIGLFDENAHPLLARPNRPTFDTFLVELLKINNKASASLEDDKEIAKKLVETGICKETTTAEKTEKTIMFLGLNRHVEIPASCRSAFDVTCLCMEERLTYSKLEQDMVLLHHEVEVDFPDGRPTERHRATLLEFGRTKNNENASAMALTVGIPAAIGALLLLENKIMSKGVLRPLEPEVYVPALDILEAFGFKILEKVD